MTAASTSKSARRADPDATRERIRDAGIVGMGGAGFPAHVKYAAQVDTVLANGAECEPLLWSDKQLMLHRSDELVAGLEIVMATVGAERGIIAVKAKYGEVVDAVRAALKARGGGGARIELYELRNFYPAGDEFSLVQQVLSLRLSDSP